MGAYIGRFDTRMASIVADEEYRQTLDGGDTRTLKSDYVLLRASGRDEWVGFRDTFEVDGRPVRDHDERLQRLVASGELAAAARIVKESAQFNLRPDLLTRTINVPTFALQLLQPANRERFSFRKAGEETIDGVGTWWIDYRERDRPTVVRTPAGRDQPSAGAVWVDPDTGEVLRTVVAWKGSTSRPLGRITVTYGRAPSIDTLVPVSMSEEYDANGATLRGSATYSNFRQFHTDARIVP